MKDLLTVLLECMNPGFLLTSVCSNIVAKTCTTFGVFCVLLWALAIWFHQASGCIRLTVEAPYLIPRSVKVQCTQWHGAYQGQKTHCIVGLNNAHSQVKALGSPAGVKVLSVFWTLLNLAQPSIEDGQSVFALFDLWCLCSTYYLTALAQLRASHVWVLVCSEEFYGTMEKESWNVSLQIWKPCFNPSLWQSDEVLSVCLGPFVLLLLLFFHLHHLSTSLSLLSVPSLLSSTPDQREKERETRLQELRQQREERTQKGLAGVGAGEVVMRKVEKSADGSKLSQVTKTDRFASSGSFFFSLSFLHFWNLLLNLFWTCILTTHSDLFTIARHKRHLGR